jgi:uncharacterized protein (DUF305 family)
MTSSTARLLGTLVLPLTLATAVVGCGSDDKTSSTATPTTAAAANVTNTASPDSVDKAFVREMVPHHEMAIDMSKLAPAKAEHPELKKLAKGIIAAQAKEIRQLNAAAKRLAVTPDAAMSNTNLQADAKTLRLDPKRLGMSMDTMSLSSAKPFDKAYLQLMLEHHEGAIVMAQAEVASGQDKRLKTIAASIIKEQSAELVEMAGWQSSWYPKKKAN